MPDSRATQAMCLAHGATRAPSPDSGSHIGPCVVWLPWGLCGFAKLCPANALGLHLWLHVLQQGGSPT
eukprot:423476-Lingulodinium_polyedra.AAC.1